MTPHRVAIVGVGPRGLVVLERLVAHARADPSRPWEVELIEPGEAGVGLYTPMPEYLLLNTVCSQVTAFSDPGMVGDAPVVEGPDLFLWAQLTGLTVSRAGEPPRAVRYDDHLPRAALGEYLAWAGQRILDAAPPNLGVRHHHTLATSVSPNGAGALVGCADGTILDVDLAVLATGHGPAGDDVSEVRASSAPPSHPLPSYPLPSYPLPSAVDSVGAGQRVAVLGAGLSAMDVVAALTVGRGGRFEGVGNERTYVPSGGEPEIVLVTRSGLLPAARPALPRGRRAAPPVHLTGPALALAREHARNEAGHPQAGLDLDRDVWPLVRAEMVHRGSIAEHPATAEDLELALQPGPARFVDAETHRAAVLARSAADLAEAELGLGRSGWKEALEVLRDHRDVLRAVVDSGLTPDQHGRFFGEFTAVVNRLAIGPQRERIAELHLLVRAGVLHLAPGADPELAADGDGWLLRSRHLDVPAEVHVDQVVAAYLHWPPPVEQDQPLWQDLGRRTRPVAVPGGTRPALDVAGRPLDPGGGPLPGLAVVGPPLEGATYYNHYVPSPGVPCRARAQVDALLAARFGLRDRHLVTLAADGTTDVLDLTDTYSLELT